jgi:hypothetical protein
MHLKRNEQYVLKAKIIVMLYIHTIQWRHNKLCWEQKQILKKNHFSNETSQEK